MATLRLLFGLMLAGSMRAADTPAAGPVPWPKSAAAAQLDAAEVGRRVAARFLQQGQFPTNYPVDINLEAVLVLGDALMDPHYADRVGAVLAARYDGDPLKVPGWRVNPFNFVTFEYWLRRPAPRFVAPFVEQARAKWREEDYSPEGALGHRRAPWPAPLLIDALQEHLSRLTRAGRVGGGREFFDEAARQWMLYRQFLRNPSTGLWAHGRGWHGGPEVVTPWPWARGQGWLLRGLVEALSVMPADEPAAVSLRAELAEYAGTLSRYQGTDAMWHQVVDRFDSYPETSGTAAISYYFARAVVQGLLPAEPYAVASKRAWSALVGGFVTAEGEVHGTCRGTPPLGSLREYLEREQIVDDHHGTAFVIMAAAGQVMLETGRSVPRVH